MIVGAAAMIHVAAAMLFPALGAPVTMTATGETNGKCQI
jgi:hypothetical protein